MAVILTRRRFTLRQLARRGDAVAPAAFPDLRLGVAEILG